MKIFRCRFCLKGLKAHNSVYDVDENISQLFYNVTGTELDKTNNSLPMYSCELCKFSLQHFSALKVQLIENQQSLLESHYNENHQNLMESTFDESQQNLEEKTDNISEVHPNFDILEIKDEPSEEISLEIEQYSTPIREAKEPPEKKSKRIICKQVQYLEEEEFDQFSNENITSLYVRTSEQTNDGISRKFHCKFPGCKKIYSQKNHVERHIREQHQNIRIECNVPNCTRSYKRKDIVVDHIRRHKDLTVDDMNYYIQRLKQTIANSARNSVTRDTANGGNSELWNMFS